MVEFALVIPILLVLLLAIADFGRIFATSIVLEAASRDAAEAAAQEYLSNPPGPLDLPAPAGNDAYYAALNVKTARIACAAARELPNADYDPSDGTCKTWPVIRVCVHDGVDGQCGKPITGFASVVPPGCTDMNAAWDPTQNGSTERWVEVRTCYRFSSLLNAPLFTFADFHLERRRQFVIPCYFVLGSAPCG